MRWALPSAGVVFVLLAACSSATTRGGPNPNDKPGGAIDIQPGSGGTYQDVRRSMDSATERRGRGDTAQPTGVNPPPEPSPEPKSPPPPHEP